MGVSPGTAFRVVSSGGPWGVPQTVTQASAGDARRAFRAWQAETAASGPPRLEPGQGAAEAWSRASPPARAETVRGFPMPMRRAD
ncbi:MAG: hypothetical protein IBJ11_03160 [Phycisphaerales bacterium]|nr:hypothetical protein [Phycisphaerales bacterium]